MLFQFKEGILNSGFPFDTIKLQKPIIGKAAETEVIAKDIVQAYAHGKLPIDAEKLTKRQIVEYLQNVDKISLKQLTNDLDKLGFELLKVIPVQNIYKFSHVKNAIRGTGKAKANLESSKYMVEIHCDAKSGAHMHITDSNGNVYDKYLNNLTAKFRSENPGLSEKIIEKRVERLPEAHIEILEFVELNLRPRNE